MITHYTNYTNCPECGERLIKGKCAGWWHGIGDVPMVKCSNINLYLMGHYCLYFNKDGNVLFKKNRISLINGILYNFYSIRNEPITRISYFDKDSYIKMIFCSNESLVDIDEIFFMKKIIKMKAFL